MSYSSITNLINNLEIKKKFGEFWTGKISEQEIKENLIDFINIMGNNDNISISRKVDDKSDKILFKYNNKYQLISFNIIGNSTSKGQFLKFNIGLKKIKEVYKDKFDYIENEILLKMFDKDKLYSGEKLKGTIFVPTSGAIFDYSTVILKWLQLWKNFAYWINEDFNKIEWKNLKKMPYDKKTLRLNLYKINKKIESLDEEDIKKLKEIKIESEIKLDRLQKVINSDINEARQCYQHNLYKGYAALCGSTMEGLLIDWYKELENKENNNIGTLFQIINWFYDEDIIDTNINEDLHFIRKARNGIHPERYLIEENMEETIRSRDLLSKIENIFKYRLMKLEHIINS